MSQAEHGRCTKLFVNRGDLSPRARFKLRALLAHRFLAPAMRLHLLLVLLAGVSALRPYAGLAAPRLPLAASVRMSNAPATGGIDWAQTVKYPLATVAQAGLIATLFRAVDACVQLPAPLVPPLFAFLSLRSRLFSLLPADRHA